jgi:hypothetical protein
MLFECTPSQMAPAIRREGPGLYRLPDTDQYGWTWQYRPIGLCCLSNTDQSACISCPIQTSWSVLPAHYRPVQTCTSCDDQERSLIGPFDQACQRHGSHAGLINCENPSPLIQLPLLSGIAQYLPTPQAPGPGCPCRGVGLKLESRDSENEVMLTRILPNSSV